MEDVGHIGQFNNFKLFVTNVQQYECYWILQQLIWVFTVYEKPGACVLTTDSAAAKNAHCECVTVWGATKLKAAILHYYNIDKSHHTDITTQHSNKTAANNERCSNATRN